MPITSSAACLPFAAIGTAVLQISISARDTQFPLQMPDIRLQANPCPPIIDQSLLAGGVHSASRMRPQRLRKQCFIEDEGRPLGVGLQELASNHLKLRGLRVRVVSVEEKAERIPSDECW